MTAGRWSTMMTRTRFRHWKAPLVQHACSNVEGLRVLDMGCGTRRHTLWLAQAVPR